MQTILSPNRYVGRAASPAIRLLVVHTMEVAETSSVAEAVARSFADPKRRASAHICSDNDSDVRCVPDKDTAWAAPGANADGLQWEAAGRAGQTPAQWDDAYSKAVLRRGHRVFADWSRLHSIPVRQLTNAQLADGVSKGIVTHNQVSQVFHLSDHWDPGLSFPMLSFVAGIKALLGSSPASPKPSPTVGVPKFPGITRLGSRGAAVLAVQRRLRARGWTISVDGAFGPATDKVVRAFQREKRLTADGVVGPKTWAALWTAKVT